MTSNQQLSEQGQIEKQKILERSKQELTRHQSSRRTRKQTVIAVASLFCLATIAGTLIKLESLRDRSLSHLEAGSNARQLSEIVEQPARPTLLEKYQAESRPVDLSRYLVESPSVRLLQVQTLTDGELIESFNQRGTKGHLVTIDDRKVFMTSNRPMAPSNTQPEQDPDQLF